MKKAVFAIGLAVACLSVASCKGTHQIKVKGTGDIVTKTFEVESADELVVYDLLAKNARQGIVSNLTFTQSDSKSVSITTNESLFEEIDVEVSKNVLRIKGDWNNYYVTEQMDIVVSGYVFEKVEVESMTAYLNQEVMSDALFELDASSVSTVRIEDINGGNYAFDCSGASRVICSEIICNDLVLDASGASNITAESVQCNTLVIDGTGASNITLPKIVSKKIVADFNGASVLRMAVTTEKLNVELSGASTAYISGTSTDLILDESGASSFDSLSLVVDSANLGLSGASNAYVTINTKLIANASGASNIHYAGTVQDINSKATGASSVKRIS